MRSLFFGVLLFGTGCAGVLPGPAPDGTPPAESRHDLVRAFHEQGWTTIPLQFVQPVGIVGQGTVYSVHGRTVVVYDYASAEEAAAAALDDARRLRRLAAGRGATVYRRPALVVLTYGRTRTAFDLELARILSGPSVRKAIAPERS